VSHGIDHNIVSKLINPMPSYDARRTSLDFLWWTFMRNRSVSRQRLAYLLKLHDGRRVTPIRSREKRVQAPSASASASASSSSFPSSLLIVRCRIGLFPPTRRSILTRDRVPATQFTSGFDCLMLARSTEASRRPSPDRFFPVVSRNSDAYR